MGSEKDTVHIIESDEPIRHRLAELLSTVDVRVLCYPDAESFLEQHAIQDADPGCLLVDAQLPGLGAVPLLQRLDTMGIDLPVMVLASSHEKDTAQMALGAGAVCVLYKPLVNSQLLSRLQHMLKKPLRLLSGARKQLSRQNGTEVTPPSSVLNDTKVAQLFVRTLSDPWYRRFFRASNGHRPICAKNSCTRATSRIGCGVALCSISQILSGVLVPNLNGNL